MKRVASVVCGLILILFFWQGLSNASFKLYVEEDEVLLQEPLVMINGNIMIPLHILEEYLGAQISVSESDGGISVMFPDQTIIMRLNEKSSQVDGETFKLDVAPRCVDDGIIVPLRFIADRRGLNLVFVQELMALRLEGFSPLEKPGEAPQKQVEVLEEEGDLKEIIYMGGPRSRVFIDLASYTGYQTNLLVNPPRLVLDLFGVDGDALPQVDVDDVIVKKIRSSRFDEQTIRIVFDLNNPTGYQISPWPDGGVEIEFNYLLTDLGLKIEDGLAGLWLEISAEPTFRVVYLEDPDRLVIDLQNTTLIGSARNIATEHDRIKRLRANQHVPSTTRIVLDLEEPVSPLPMQQEGSRFTLPLFAGSAAEAAALLSELEPEPKPQAADEAAREPVATGSLGGLVIVVDPGHGGSDPGTIGYRGTFEKDIVLTISKFLGELLKEAGAQVVYTREKDVYVSIFDRPQLAIEAGADIYVSVHVNSHLKRGTVRGTETLYRAGDQISQLLARSVQDELVKSITLIDRRIWPRDDLAIFNGSTIPAVLVEVGFLDHPEEEILLKAEGFQQVAAEGIFQGILRFFEEVKKAGGTKQ